MTLRYTNEQDARFAYGRDVLPYSYKPDAIIALRNGENPATTLTLGFELEMELERFEICRAASLARTLLELTNGRAYLKRDASVSNGFELVTHPASLAYHQYEEHWSGVCAKAVKHKFRSHDVRQWGGTRSCGLHVHVGRKQLGRTDEERVQTVRKLTAIVEHFANEMTVFSRRSSYQLESWAGFRYGTSLRGHWGSLSDENSDFIRTRNTHDDRYYAINCENAATVEFRLFNGTLKRDTLIATLQLVHNICDYARSHTWEEIQSDDVNFLTIARYKVYNELDSYLAARGLAESASVNTRAQNTRRNPIHAGADGVEG